MGTEEKQRPTDNKKNAQVEFHFISRQSAQKAEEAAAVLQREHCQRFDGPRVPKMPACMGMYVMA